MSEGEKSDKPKGLYFAYGFLVGAFLIIGLVLLDLLSQEIQYFKYDNSKIEHYRGQNNADWNDNKKNSKPITNRYYTTQDTLAQWFMAIMAFAATVISIWAVKLVRDTLKATRETVEVTRGIGEAQTRAHLYIKSFSKRKTVSVTDVNGEHFSTYFEIEIGNCGNTPAYSPFIKGFIDGVSSTYKTQGAPPVIEPSGAHCLNIIIDHSEHLENIDIVIEIGFVDIFKKRISSKYLCAMRYGYPEIPLKEYDEPKSQKK